MKRAGPSRRQIRVPLLVALPLCLLLCVALLLVALSYRSYKQESEAAFLTLQTMKEGPSAEADGPITPDEIKARALAYSGYLEFLQSFFPEEVVYRDEGNVIRFEQIDRTLQQHTYDWSKLAQSAGRKLYQDDNIAVRFGIDVSKFQGDIDWQRVKADGVDFAMLRIGIRGYGESGKISPDEAFLENIDNAQSAGLDVGVYFFTQAVTVQEAVEEADWVLERLDGRALAYPIALDVEFAATEGRASTLTPAEQTDAILAFCERIEQAGYTPMIYSSTPWFLSKMELPRLEKYQKWLAQTYETPAFPYAFSMWQYTFAGNIDGIEGDVDCNLHFAVPPEK